MNAEDQRVGRFTRGALAAAVLAVAFVTRRRRREMRT
jgi:MYXO-CTERM domain-containing protein